MSKNILYIIIVILVLLNVLTLGMLLGRSWFSRFPMVGMTRENTWEEMSKHMEEMEGEHDESGMVHKSVNYNKPVAETHNSTYDFGQVSQAGGVVSTTFEIENHGKEVLKIGEISTSCGCTSADINKTELGFNEETELTVFFNPNYHEEPEGKFTRSVFVPTNDPDLPEMQFDIFVEIVD